MPLSKVLNLTFMICLANPHDNIYLIYNNRNSLYYSLTKQRFRFWNQAMITAGN